MRKALVLSAVLLFVGVSNISAQTFYPNVSEPQPLAELGIPFARDDFFFANYSANTLVVYVNNREMVTVPANTYRRAAFYVASKTKVVGYTNIVTDKGTRRVKMKSRRVVLQRQDGTIDSGWMFFL